MYWRINQVVELFSFFFFNKERFFSSWCIENIAKRLTWEDHMNNCYILSFLCESHLFNLNFWSLISFCFILFLSSNVFRYFYIPENIYIDPLLSSFFSKKMYHINCCTISSRQNCRQMLPIIFKNQWTWKNFHKTGLSTQISLCPKSKTSIVS